MNPSLSTPWEPVLEYWFGDSLSRGWPARSRNGLWFRADDTVDRSIAELFGHFVDAALFSELVEWEADPHGRLALVLLLDQFPRNIYRGTARAFAGDHRAVTLVSEGLARGMDRQLPWIGRVFFYMPLMHAEDLSLQDRCLRCFEGLRADMPEELSGEVEGNIAFAREHRELIARFGRFPYRNAVLERDSTEEERQWLEHGARYGQ
jgi:uncharacterized protein (DUF924 family)